MNDDNFYSIDRLIEFGMSTAVAQQMVQSMNKAISTMQIPGDFSYINSTKQTFYFAIIDGLQMGPFSEQEISRLISEKKIMKETYIWKPGLVKWQIAEQLPEILKLVALNPPPFDINK